MAKCCISLGDVVSAEQALDRVVELDSASGPGLVQAEQHALAQLKKFQADTEQAYQAKDYRKVNFVTKRNTKCLSHFTETHQIILFPFF